MAQAALERGRSGVGVDDVGLLGEGCVAATALLAAGRREPARSLIRILARANAMDALPTSLHSTLSALIREFAAWTGDLEFLEKYPVSDRWDEAGHRHKALGGGALTVIPQVVDGIWGLLPSAVREELSITLQPSPAPTELALTGLRIGRTTLTLRYRRRPGQVVLRCEVTRGPALRLQAALAGAGAVEVSVDEVALGGGRAVFRASGSHEVVFGTEG